jgi:hypothetical protein
MVSKLGRCAMLRNWLAGSMMVALAVSTGQGSGPVAASEIDAAAFGLWESSEAAISAGVLVATSWPMQMADLPPFLVPFVDDMTDARLGVWRELVGDASWIGSAGPGGLPADMMGCQRFGAAALMVIRRAPGLEAVDQLSDAALAALGMGIETARQLAVLVPGHVRHLGERAPPEAIAGMVCTYPVRLDASAQGTLDSVELALKARFAEVSLEKRIFDTVQITARWPVDAHFGARLEVTILGQDPDHAPAPMSLFDGLDGFWLTTYAWLMPSGA